MLHPTLRVVNIKRQAYNVYRRRTVPTRPITSLITWSTPKVSVKQSILTRAFLNQTCQSAFRYNAVRHYGYDIVIFLHRCKINDVKSKLVVALVVGPWLHARHAAFEPRGSANFSTSNLYWLVRSSLKQANSAFHPIWVDNSSIRNGSDYGLKCSHSFWWHG